MKFHNHAPVLLTAAATNTTQKSQLEAGHSRVGMMARKATKYVHVCMSELQIRNLFIVGMINGDNVSKPQYTLRATKDIWIRHDIQAVRS